MVVEAAEGFGDVEAKGAAGDDGGEGEGAEGGGAEEPGMRRTGVAGEDRGRGGGGGAPGGEPALGPEGQEGGGEADEDGDDGLAGLRGQPGAQAGGGGEKAGGGAADGPAVSGENIAAEEAARRRAADGIFAEEEVVGRALVIRDGLAQNDAAVEFEAQRCGGGFGCADEGIEGRQRDAQGVAAAGDEGDGFGGRAAEAPVVVGKRGGGAVEVVDDQEIRLAEGAGGNQGLAARRRAGGEFQLEGKFAGERREGAREAEKREGGEGREADERGEETADRAWRFRRGVTHGAGVGRSEKKPSTRVRSRW